MRIIFAFLLLFSHVTFSQFNLEDFSGLKSQGLIPEVFVKNSSEKFTEARNDLKNDQIDDQFLIETNFFLDELLLSGNIVFNDPISLYLKHLGQELLKNNQELSDSLQFYTLKSNIPNAFSTDQGIIIVTSGLIGRCTNENMLAFVLAHEIAHFTEKHVRKSHIHTRNLDKDKSKSEIDYDIALKEISKYSKANEFDADKIGSQIYLEAGFPKSGILEAFEMLEHSQGCMINEVFNHEVLNLPSFKFSLSDSLFKNEIKWIKPTDSSLTHPNIDARKEKFKHYSDEFSNNEANLRFRDIQELALFESVNLYNQKANYFNALHLIGHLSKKQSNNSFLKFSKIHALYGIAMHESLGTQLYTFKDEYYSNSIVSYLYNFFDRFDSFEHLIFAYSHVLNANKIDPSLLGELPYQEHIEDQLNNHYSRVKKLINDRDSLNLHDTTGNDAYFLQSILEISDEAQFLKNICRQKKSLDTVFKSKPTRRNLDILLISKSKHENVLYLDPQYERLGKEKNGKFYLKSEDEKILFSERLKLMVTDFDSNATVMVPLAYNSGQKNDFNDFILINSWLTDRFWSSSELIINSQQKFLNNNTNLNSSSHLILSGISAYKTRRKLMDHPWSHYYLAPYYLINTLIVRNKFEMQLFSINLKTGKLEALMYKSVKFKGGPNTIDFHYYDLLFQLYAQNIDYNTMYIYNR